jgi:hypothetical protein
MRAKKPPHHVGEDRDGVYGKENRVYWLLRVLLLLLKASFLSFLHPCNLTQLIHSLLVLGFKTACCSGVSRWNIWLRTFAISTWRATCSCAIFLPERAQRFHQNFLR